MQDIVGNTMEKNKNVSRSIQSNLEAGEHSRGLGNYRTNIQEGRM